MKHLYEKSPNGWICRPAGEAYKNQPFCVGLGRTRKQALESLRHWLDRDKYRMPATGRNDAVAK
jgi:hypothetical protein